MFTLTISEGGGERDKIQYCHAYGKLCIGTLYFLLDPDN